MLHGMDCMFLLLTLSSTNSVSSAAGYNNLEVAEYLLEHGADVNAQDKGGLIPLHNAASYGVSTEEAVLVSSLAFSSHLQKRCICCCSTHALHT